MLLAFDGEQVSQARVVLGEVNYAPIRLIEAEVALSGKCLDEKALDAAAAIAAVRPCEGDEVSPPEFRQHLAGVFVRRALRKAMERTKASING